MLAAVDMKEEQVNKTSCSPVHSGVGWSCKVDGEYCTVLICSIDFFACYGSVSRSDVTFH